MLKSLILHLIRRAGYTLSRPKSLEQKFDGEMYDIPAPFAAILKKRLVKIYRRDHAALNAVRYVIDSDTPGAIVECGVLQGRGAALLADSMMRQWRPLWLYDVFENDPRRIPDADEMELHTGRNAREAWLESHKAANAQPSLDAATRAVASTGYPMEQVRFVKGLVQETLPGTMPEQISVLKLHTDYQDSIRHCLEHLFPRLSPGGVLIIEAYGRYPGTKKATDDYFRLNGIRMMLNRVDDSCRVGVKDGSPPA